MDVYGFDDKPEKPLFNRMHWCVSHSQTALFCHILIALHHWTLALRGGAQTRCIDTPISDRFTQYVWAPPLNRMQHFKNSVIKIHDAIMFSFYFRLHSYLCYLINRLCGKFHALLWQLLWGPFPPRLTGVVDNMCGNFLRSDVTGDGDLLCTGRDKEGEFLSHKS